MIRPATRNSFPRFVSRTGFQFRNEILVPLHTREKTIGVLATINKKEGQFSEDDLQLLSSLAGVVAMAVENSTFFQEMLDAFRELEDLNLVKSKILNHLSHELRTPLAIIRGSLVNMRKKLNDMGIADFERSMERMERHIQSLNRLEAQVESIMMTGYAWERRQIAGFLKAALDLMEVQTEYTPEIQRATSIIATWLEKTFPTRRDELERIRIKDFGDKVFELIKGKAAEIGRKVRVDFRLNNTAELLIPSHVLQAVIEGLIRNAIEATPDHGLVKVTGGLQGDKGDRYIITVKDTGIGIPEKIRNAYSKASIPFKIPRAMRANVHTRLTQAGRVLICSGLGCFQKLYHFNLSFTSSRCPYIKAAGDSWTGDAGFCEECEGLKECPHGGGSEFVVDFPLAHVSPLAASGRPLKAKVQTEN